MKFCTNMSKKNLNLAPNGLLERNCDCKFYKGFLESENHFERPRVADVETTIFLNRLIGIFEILMTKLEFAVNQLSLIFTLLYFTLLYWYGRGSRLRLRHCNASVNQINIDIVCSFQFVYRANLMLDFCFIGCIL